MVNFAQLLLHRARSPGVQDRRSISSLLALSGKPPPGPTVRATAQTPAASVAQTLFSRGSPSASLCSWTSPSPWSATNLSAGSGHALLSGGGGARNLQRQRQQAWQRAGRLFSEQVADVQRHAQHERARGWTSAAAPPGRGSACAIPRRFKQHEPACSGGFVHVPDGTEHALGDVFTIRLWTDERSP
jgi:hypothetical protein